MPVTVCDPLRAWRHRIFCGPEGGQNRAAWQMDWTTVKEMRKLFVFVDSIASLSDGVDDLQRSRRSVAPTSTCRPRFYMKRTSPLHQLWSYWFRPRGSSSHADRDTKTIMILREMSKRRKHAIMTARCSSLVRSGLLHDPRDSSAEVQLSLELVLGSPVHDS